MPRPSESPRIVIDARTVRPGATGVGNYTAGLLLGLEELARERSLPPIKALRLKGTEEHPAWNALSFVEPVEVAADYESHPRGDFFLQLGIDFLTFRLGANVLVSPAFLAPLGPRAFRRLLIVHDLLAWTNPASVPAPFRHYLKWMVWLGMQNADVLATSSPTIRPKLERYSGRDFRLLPPGVDATVFHPGTEAPDGANDTRPLLLYTASFEPRKNHGILLEAVRRLRNEGESLRLVLLHRPSASERERMMRLAGDPSVEIVEPTSAQDVAAWTRRADVVVFPSRAEGFGMPALEAMACGTPLVASDIAAMRWLTSNGEAARLVPWNDPAEWTAALRSVLHGRDEGVQRRVEAGLRRAEPFRWKRTAKRLLKAIADDSGR